MTRTKKLLVGLFIAGWLGLTWFVISGRLLLWLQPTSQDIFDIVFKAPVEEVQGLKGKSRVFLDLDLHITFTSAKLPPVRPFPETPLSSCGVLSEDKRTNKDARKYFEAQFPDLIEVLRQDDCELLCNRRMSPQILVVWCEQEKRAFAAYRGPFKAD